MAKVGARILQNKSSALLLFSVIILEIVTLSPAFSLLIGSLVINNIGKISLSITAQSGSSIDIQTAVNAMGAAGGGTVYVPAGNFTFNINFTVVRVNNQYAGVQIPGGVSVIGVGNNQTILFCPLTSWNYSLMIGQALFMLNGLNSKPIRISGIYFQGSVNTSSGADDNRNLCGILSYGVKDYRIDHCTFIDFCNLAIQVSNNYVTKWNRGVIDHCIFDNPYKETFLALTGNRPYWAYGIGVNGEPWTFDSNWDNWFGQYRNNTCVIEDCSFARCRHMVAGGQNGYYILRYSNMTDMIVGGYGSYQDVHGGGEGCEVYNCTIINTALDNRSYADQPPKGSGTTYLGIGLYSRGGFALYYNNTIKYFNASASSAITLTNDQSNYTLRTTGVWIWNNMFVDVTTQLGITPNAFPIDEGVDYFRYAKPGYVPYTYPHPLTQP